MMFAALFLAWMCTAAVAAFVMSLFFVEKDDFDYGSDADAALGVRENEEGRRLQ